MPSITHYLFITKVIPRILGFIISKHEYLKIYKIRIKVILIKSECTRDINPLKQRSGLHNTCLNIREWIRVCV